MPIDYQIDSQRQIVYTTATGVLTDDEIMAHKLKLTRDPLFQPGMVELSDVRGISALEVTSQGVHTFVAQDESDSDRLENYRLAIVVGKDEVYGMARMYQMLTEKNVQNVQVFRDLEKAESWLGVPPAR